MDSHPTPYARILAGIREQLTGDPERDLPFLNEQAERYREEPWARPFLRELGRIFYDLMPAEQRAEAARVLDAEMERMQALQQQAWEHLEQGRLDQAQNLLDELRQAVQGLGESDLDAAFVDYSDPLEAEFHRLTDPKAKTFRPSPLSHRPLLILQARIHLLRDEPEQALEVLGQAVSRGPVSARLRLLRLEVLQDLGRAEQAFQEALQTLPLCHVPKDLAWGWRILGWCLAELGRGEAALVALLYSLHHRWDPSALAQLVRLLDAPAAPNPEECVPRAAEVLKTEGIPPGPDPLWLEAARNLQERSGSEEDEEAVACGAQVQAALEVPDLDAVLRRYRDERIRPTADPELESTPAGRFLRSLQESMVGWFSRAQAEQAAKTLQESLDRAEEAGNQPFWASQWTGVEAGRDLLFGQPILAEMGGQILELAARKEMPAGPAAAWGVLPLPGQGGRVLLTPEGERVPVLFAGSLFFAYLLGKVLASCLPVLRLEDGEEGLGFHRTGIEEHLRTATEVHQRFVELMVSAVRGNPGMAPPWILGGTPGPLASLLCEAAEFFLLAEQFALAAQEPTGARIEPLEEGLEVQTLVFAEQEQIQAVAIAMQLAAAIQAEEGLGFDLCVAAIVAHLSGLSLVEQLSGTAEREDITSARIRYMVILELLRQHVPDALELSENMLHTMDLLWQHNGAAIMELLKAGE
ncbi:MAG: hypothetical protein ACOX9B_10640 [Candidatus Xenobium sp.]|jgi:tetratricopeptide (TPR) repeat protein|nr:hypothetical protein [Burkholderiales bacterium]